MKTDGVMPKIHWHKIKPVYQLRPSKSSVVDYISKSPLLRYGSSSLLSTKSTTNDNGVKGGGVAAGQQVLLLREHHVMSLDHLNPHPSCQTRKSSALIAIINLVATVCGGGVLSLPLAFLRAGIVPTTILMILGAVTTDFALVCLVDAARKTGARTYGDVAAAAFGSFSQVVTTFTLALMLCGTLIAYQVLVKDIWTPVVFFLLSLLSTMSSWSGGDADADVDAGEATREQANMLLACILLLSLPLSLQKDLHALRHTCYVGFSSCVLLMAAVVFRACQKIHGIPSASAVSPAAATTTTFPWSKVKWCTDDVADLLFAFPIVVLCYFCSFNVLAVHSQMMNPSRNRIRFVLSFSIFVCCCLFFGVGLCGYLYTVDTFTPDNIMLAFDLNDKAVLAGRMGFCLTLLFGMPLVLLPCREAIVSLPAQVREWKRDTQLISQFKKLNEAYDEAHVLVEEGSVSSHDDDADADSSTSLKNMSKSRTANTYGATCSEITASGHILGSPHLVINGVDFDGKAPTLVDKDPVHRHGMSILPVVVNKHGLRHADGLARRGGGDEVTTYVISNEDEESFLETSPFLHASQHVQKDDSKTFSELPTTITMPETLILDPIVEISTFEDEAGTRTTLDEDNTKFLWCCPPVGYDSFQHVAATLVIVTVCYLVAIAVPGVAMVWSIVGSSMAIWIAFIVPTGCFLRIRQHKGLTMQALYAWLLLIFSFIAMIICTRQAVLNAAMAAASQPPL